MWKRFLIAGCLVWLPIIATVWVIKFLVNLFDDLINILPVEYQPEQLFHMHIPGLGIVLAAIIVLFTGLLVTNFLGTRLMDWFDKGIRKIPFIGSIYGTFKQVTQTVLSSDGESFRKVVLIEYPRKSLWTIAFQTGEVQPSLGLAYTEPMISVYVPTTPNPTGGFLIFIAKSEVIELSMSVDEALKHVVSLGTLSTDSSDN